ncbi:PEP/pyruvate-binding domain-containing protein [uncultured Alcanivorax sp.]|nr:PEP/pyruvate-binding domain-containing protein [uncultured Alcanivorax sp.]
MVRLGLPVPPGFVISTDVCHQYHGQNLQGPDRVAQQPAPGCLAATGQR